MSVFDFLNNAAPGVVTKNSTSQLPPWYENYQRGLLASATAAGSEPFHQDPNQRIANLTAPQTQAMGQEASINTATAPLAQSGANAMQEGTAPFDPAKLKSMMNPYSDQVAEDIGRKDTDLWNNQILPGVNDQFTQAGQFGSQRHEQVVGQNEVNLQRQMGADQTAALAQGYQTGMTGMNTMANTDVYGGQASIGAAQSGAGGLAQAGALQQGQNQKSLSLAEQDYQTQLNYPKTQLDWMKSVAPGAPNQGALSTATSTTDPGQSTATLGLGALSAGLGAYNSINNANIAQQNADAATANAAANTAGNWWDPAPA